MYVALTRQPCIHVYIHKYKYTYMSINIYIHVCAAHYHDRCGHRLASTRHPHAHIHIYTHTHTCTHINMYAIHDYICMHKYIYIHANIYVCAAHYHDRCGRRLASTRHPYVQIHIYTHAHACTHIYKYIYVQHGRRVSAVADVHLCIVHKYKCIYEYICIHAHVQKLQNYLLVHTMNSRRGAGNVWRLWQLAV